MVDGGRTLDGPLAQKRAEVVSIAEQGYVITHLQLMEVANARLMDQATPKENPATPIRAHILRPPQNPQAQ